MIKTKRAIVTTTINKPTEALDKFIRIAKQDDWHIFIVGDKKTPHSDYMALKDKYDFVHYISPSDQVIISKELSDLIGWNCIQRRNFGLIQAYNWGAEIIATVDDDNIPYPKWGKNVKVNNYSSPVLYRTANDVFDPLVPTFPQFWHRGFPIQLLDERHFTKITMRKTEILVQADLWNGSPDVDAICRITHDPNVMFKDYMAAYATTSYSPFNSQNTFLSRKVIRDYFLFPHIGRMDDIWASYWLQTKFPKESIIYSAPTVMQDRNPHDLVKDLEQEMIGYKHTLDFIKWCQSLVEGAKVEWPEYMPKKAIKAFEVYRSLLK